MPSSEPCSRRQGSAAATANRETGARCVAQATSQTSLIKASGFLQPRPVLSPTMNDSMQVFDRRRAPEQDRAALQWRTYIPSQRDDRTLQERLPRFAETFRWFSILAATVALWRRGCWRIGMRARHPGGFLPKMARCAAANGQAARGRRGRAALAPQNDLVVSLLDLQWVNDLPGSLLQIRQCLKPVAFFSLPSSAETRCTN